MKTESIFSSEMSADEFEAHYWYKDELIAICRQNGLSSHGTKAELQKRVISLLQGQALEDNRKASAIFRKKQQPKEITLEMKLIPDGFKFNKQARNFFANYFGVKKFSFTKEMAAALREAEHASNYDMTVADLIEVYKHSRLNKTGVGTDEDKTYQWNHFVKEFNADPQTKGLKNRMKVAALLWRRVRDEKGSKEYRPTLFQQFTKDVAEIEKEN